MSSLTSQPKVLFVDDEQNVLQGFTRQLRSQFNIDSGTSPVEMLKLLEEKGPYAVVVSDMRMPEMNGIAFLNEIERRNPDTIRIMLTGNIDYETAVKAVNDSRVFKFLSKPCSIESLQKAVNEGIARYQVIMAEKDLMQRTLGGSVKLLTDLMALANPEKFGLALSAREPLKILANAVGYKNTWELELSLMLGFINMLAIPSNVRAKIDQAQQLSDAEQKLLEQAPLVSHRLLCNIPRLESAAKLVLYIDRNFDGTGSPTGDKVSGEELPLGSRLIRIARDYQTLIEKGLTPALAVTSLQKLEGRYDPKILSLLVKPVEREDENKVEAPTQYEIAVEDLCAGQKLLSDILTKDGVLLMGKGAVLTESIVHKVQAYSDLVGIKQPILVDARIPTLK